MSKNKEYRVINAPVEFREADDGGNIEGIASVVGVETDLGWFKEVIMEGAFDDVLNGDTRALFNHDSNQVLARTTSGTLALTISDKGDLVYSYKTPNRSYAKDLEDMIKTGDVSQSSFAFTVKEDSWEYNENEDRELRKIIKIEKLFDVSPVTFPAYADTTVAKRCFDDECKIRSEKKASEDTTEEEKKSKANKEYIKRRLKARKIGR